MKVRSAFSPILALSLSCFAAAQQTRGDGNNLPAMHAITNAGMESKEDLMHRIVIEENALRKAESVHTSSVELGVRYAQLALSYEDSAEFDKAEAALKHSVSLLRNAPDAGPNLATAIGQLGSLHVAMRKFRASEQEEQEALRLRLNSGDRLKIARSWSDLAALSLAERKFDKARDFAEMALHEFKANDQSAVIDSLSAQFALAMAYCYLKEYSSAIPVLKEAVAEAKEKLNPDDFPIGFGSFLLGYAYWKSGDMQDAGPQFREGTAQMSKRLGWGHPAYLSALTQYATFLKQNNQKEVAAGVELQIRQAQAVVDVHSLQSTQGIGINGLR
jgi:tetratricopeptide (TPR) repeat protein